MCSFLLFVISLAVGILAAVVVEHCVQAMQRETQIGNVHTGYRAASASGGKQSDELTKKVALTFDDDVIIGLSQEISYKEAVSMI